MAHFIYQFSPKKIYIYKYRIYLLLNVMVNHARDLYHSLLDLLANQMLINHHVLDIQLFYANISFQLFQNLSFYLIRSMVLYLSLKIM
jgi:hypothetical protein